MIGKRQKATKRAGNVLVTCGGTFGHIRPALTVANELERQGHGVVLMCSNKDKIFPLVQERSEQKTVFLRMSGFPTRKHLISWFVFLFRVVEGIRRTMYVFFSRKISYLVVSGSFISYPALFCAKLLRIPYSILEQNTVPGFVSRQFFRRARHIFFAIPPLNKDYRNLSQALIVGNPSNLPRYTREEALEYFQLDQTGSHRKIVGIIGGSLGANALTEWVVQQKGSPEWDPSMLIVCITGQTLYDKYKEEADSSLHLVSFVCEIAYFYALCDVVVARAGASTISELIKFQKPTLFVPYPFATQNHQWYNAKEALSYLPGEIVLEENLKGYSLRQVLDILQDRQDQFDSSHGEEFSLALEKIMGILGQEL